MNAVQALLTRLIDYAGLFPPASLPMKDAVRNYLDYDAGGQAWMLGRFIVSVDRLPEFEQVFERQHRGSLLVRNPQAVRLSALAGGNLAPERGLRAPVLTRLRKAARLAVREAALDPAEGALALARRSA